MTSFEDEEPTKPSHRRPLTQQERDARDEANQQIIQAALVASAQDHAAHRVEMRAEREELRRELAALRKELGVTAKMLDAKLESVADELREKLNRQELIQHRMLEILEGIDHRSQSTYDEVFHSTPLRRVAGTGE